MSTPSFKLSSGFGIPAIGLGTWQAKPDSDPVPDAVAYAIKEVGYRHIDCAWNYGNEKTVGEGIHQSGIPRSEIFITSKLWCTYHSRVEECLDQTLENLGTDYLDLYLMHWPVPLNPNGNHPTFPTLPDGTRDVDHSWDIRDTWKQMEALVRKGKTKIIISEVFITRYAKYATGKVRSIGVSNCSQVKIAHLLETAEILPVVNQLELHVYNPQHKLLAYLKSKGILAQAYSPLGSSNAPLLSDEVVVEIAAKHSLKSADVLLGYLLSKDIVILPKSVNKTRIASNYKGAAEAAGKLDKSDIERLDGLAAGGKQKRFIAPPWPVDLGFEDWPKAQA